MKNLLFTVVGLIAFNSQAQVTKDMGDFSEIRTTNRIKVELIPSSESKVVLDSKDESNITLVNKNGKLAIKNTLKELVSDSDYKVSVKVYYKNLNSIEAESGSYVFNTKTIDSNSLKISSSSGSQVHLKVKTKTLEAKVFAGANITLEGSGTTGILIGTAGGVIDASKLILEDATATVNAGGKIEVKAKNNVEATTRAGGYINIYGNPKTVTEKTTAGGTIKRVK